MTFTLSIDLPAAPETAFELLSEPGRRPEWQASLRAVEILTDGPTGVGTRWHDVTWPGLRPLMEITCSEPGVRWSERGLWRGVIVDLVLDFTPSATGTNVTATGTTYATGPMRGIGRVLDLLGPVAARDDLRRAARLLGAQ